MFEAYLCQNQSVCVVLVMFWSAIQKITEHPYSELPCMTKLPLFLSCYILVARDTSSGVLRLSSTSTTRFVHLLYSLLVYWECLYYVTTHVVVFRWIGPTSNHLLCDHLHSYRNVSLLCHVAIHVLVLVVLLECCFIARTGLAPRTPSDAYHAVCGNTRIFVFGCVSWHLGEIAK